MTISFDSKVTVPDDVLVSQLQGESVLLNLKSECYHGLDEVGTRFWELLTSSESIQSAYEALLSEYAVDPDTLRGDLTELVGALQEKGLVELA
jgi:hypothetical protein